MDPTCWSSQLVEQRVKRSLSRVASGRDTPQQALQTVVQQLHQELSGQQFQQLVDYFKFKQTTGQLTAAKQLLLQLLCAVRIPASGHATYKEQGQQYSATLCNSKAAAASSAGCLQSLQHQQQHAALEETAQVAAASSAADTSSRRRDQALSPAGPSQQQELRSALPNFYSSTPAASVAASGSSSKALAFRQSLSPLQL